MNQIMLHASIQCAMHSKSTLDVFVGTNIEVGLTRISSAVIKFNKNCILKS